MKFEFSRRIFEKSQISGFIKIWPVKAELFHADRRTDGHDKANARFSQFCERAKKVQHLIKRDNMAPSAVSGLPILQTRAIVLPYSRRTGKVAHRNTFK